MGEKLTITIKRGEDNPKPRTFLYGGIVQTVRTRLRAPVEMSDKYRQLLKRGGRCWACLHKNQTTESLTGADSTPIWCWQPSGLPPKVLHSKLLDVHHWKKIKNKQSKKYINFGNAKKRKNFQLQVQKFVRGMNMLWKKMWRKSAFFCEKQCAWYQFTVKNYERNLDVAMGGKGAMLPLTLSKITCC